MEMSVDELRLWRRLARVKRPSLRVAIRNSLVEQYLWLAEDIADYFGARVPTSVSRDDLTAEAYIGLMQAVESFRLDGGASPATFMRFRITGRVRDWLRADDSLSRLDRRRLKLIDRAEQSAGRQLTDDEVCATFGFSRPTEPILRSIHKPLYDDSNERASLAEQLPDESPKQSTLDIRDCGWLLTGLGKRDRLIVLLYHVNGFPMKEVAQQLGMSESRISQVMPRLLAVVRRNAAQAGMRDRRRAA